MRPELHALFLTLMITYAPQNVIGMSVVGPDFEKLKRYNLEELRQVVTVDESEVKGTLSRSITAKNDA